MVATKVFTSGNSQAVRISKEYQIAETELYIKKNRVNYCAISENELLGKS